MKEKKAAKLQEKREKEARRLEREELAAKQRQQKRDKKSKVAEITGEDNTTLLHTSIWSDYFFPCTFQKKKNPKPSRKRWRLVN